MSDFGSAGANPSFAHDAQRNDAEGWRDITVVMLRNLPCRCTQEEIVAAVDEVGFGAYVNYLHLPTKSPGGRNCGYGFVGFITVEAAQQFRNVFEGYTLRSRTSSKQVKLKPAHRQHASEVNGLRTGEGQGADPLYTSDSILSQRAPVLQTTMESDITQRQILWEKMELVVKMLNAEQTMPSSCSLQEARLLFPPPPGLEQELALAANVGSTSIRCLSL